MGGENGERTGVFDGDLDKGIEWSQNERGVKTEELGNHSSVCADSGLEGIWILGPNIEAVRKGIENLLITPELCRMYRGLRGEILVDDSGKKTGFHPSVRMPKSSPLT
ncbi:hypothetical protein KKF04_05800 [Patescibacteria group bacterium]|nr:hypothetical protein [Patescibacteria group bacterium]